MICQNENVLRLTQSENKTDKEHDDTTNVTNNQSKKEILNRIIIPSWIKTCPKCQYQQNYKNKIQLNKAIRNNTICKTCKIKSQELWKLTREWSLHEQYKGITWKKNCHRCNSEQVYKNRRSYNKSVKRNTVCLKCQSIVRRATSINNPNYNPKACEYFEYLNQENGWNLQHALNGGEVKILQYWLDAYDRDRNIVVEYDELRHRYRLTQDIQRQNNIVRHLGCKFYRYNEATQTLQ